MKHWAVLACLAVVASCSEGLCAADPKPESPAEPPANPSVKRAPPLPELRVIHTELAPVIDGDLSDEVWRDAGKTAVFVDTTTGARAEFFSRAMALWDTQHLYVGVDVRDRFLQSTHTKHDAKLWEQDCVEMFIDPDGDAQHYFEIQVSPADVTFDTHYESRRRPKPFGHMEWESGIVSGVQVRGTLNDGQPDHGYSVEFAIPWSAFTTEGVITPAPAAGDAWKANFYVMDLQRDRQRAGSWSAPMARDFHVPARFGVLRFDDPRASFSRPARLSGERAEQIKARRPARADTPRKKIVREKLIDRRHRGKPAPLGVPTSESAAE